MVVVTLGSDDKPRERSTAKGKGEDGAITLHQGRSAKDVSGRGDKDIFEEGVTTIQIHTIRVDGVTMSALALYVPKLEDAIASGSG